MLKKIDGVVLKNSRLNAALPSSFHFEACRLISRSDRPKGCKTEDLFYGKLEAEFDDFQKSTVDFTQKHKLSHHISASHSGGECLTKFWTDWAEKNDKLVSPEDPFITINPRPRAFLTVQDHLQHSRYGGVPAVVPRDRVSQNVGGFFGFNAFRCLRL